MITYDLNNPSRNYSGVINAIKKCSTGRWYSSWKSSYLIHSYRSAQVIYDEIRPFLDSNDSLIVIEVSNNYSGQIKHSKWYEIYALFN